MFNENSKLASWKEFLNNEVVKPYFTSLWTKVKDGYNKQMLFPHQADIFKAIETTALQDIKVIIVGQDPYHNINQANGLAFAVNEGQTPPGSLKNICKEIINEYGSMQATTNLLAWANQGVLLLNSILTVVKHQPMSCKDWGWEKFTLNLIKYVLDNNDHVVVICFGRYSQKFLADLHYQNHYFLNCTHPSPLSAHNGFFNSNIFKKVNEYLEKNNKSVIQW